DQILERYRATLQPFMKWGVIAAAIIFGLFAGSGATVKWQQYLLFRHPSKFGSVDPVFHKDLGFFVFKLPFERFVFTWAFSSLMIIAIVISVLFFVNARFKNWLLPIGGIGLLLLTSIVAGGIWPAAVQRLSVTPNERIKESPYIKRNIDATRKAFGLQDTQVIAYSGLADLKASDVAANQATIQNVRLWDPGVLINQYVSLQRI